MSEIKETFENIMSQGVVTISYYNIYITTDKQVVLVTLNKGIFQELSKYSLIPLAAVGAVIFGDMQRRKMIASLRKISIDDIIKLGGVIVADKDEVNIKLGITKSSISIKGKKLRIKKGIAKKIQEAILA